MRPRKSSVGTWLISAALIVVGGCEPTSPVPQNPVSKIEAKLAGKVTANGTPVSKGKVTVSPPGPPFTERIADIRKDGTYEVTTFIGNNSISVTGTGNPAEGKSYNKTSFDVKEGTNSLDLALPLVDK